MNLEILKYIKVILFVALLIGVCACNSAKNDTNKVKTSNSKAPPKDVLVTKDGLPKPEKGITVVNKNGWTKDQREFQQRYCETMFEQVEGYDAYKFCNCFLDKVQYYYEPIYIREAYDDQKKWNSLCLEEAQS